MGSRAQPAGVLTGHLEGITFVDSRGDGRYLISNGKDQTTKLWDIRRMTSNASQYAHIPPIVTLFVLSSLFYLFLAVSLS